MAAFTRRYTSGNLAIGLETAQRDDLYAHLQRQPVAVPRPWQSGQLLNRAMTRREGKSTVARLIGRFYDPTDGRVLLGRLDLRKLSDDSLRTAVVTLTQESYLFSGSVADGIRFGRPDATRAQVGMLLESSGPTISSPSLPAGYDTEVRKRGGRLSAGQRQLVAFARAFLADPGVLVLDEATSSLDIPSERLVQRAWANSLV